MGGSWIRKSPSLLSYQNPASTVCQSMMEEMLHHFQRLTLETSHSQFKFVWRDSDQNGFVRVTEILHHLSTCHSTVFEETVIKIDFASDGNLAPHVNMSFNIVWRHGDQNGYLRVTEILHQLSTCHSTLSLGVRGCKLCIGKCKLIEVLQDFFHPPSHRMSL